MSFVHYRYPALISQGAHEAMQQLRDILGDVMRQPLLPMRTSLEKARQSISTVICPAGMNTVIKDRLMAHGWLREFSINHGMLRADFYKSGVVVEVQFGKYAFCAENIYVKFPLACRTQTAAHPVEIGVLVLPTRAMASQMSTGIGTYEQTMRNYVTPLLDNINYNLVVLGLEYQPQSASPMNAIAAEQNTCVSER